MTVTVDDRSPHVGPDPDLWFPRRPSRDVVGVPLPAPAVAPPPPRRRSGVTPPARAGGLGPPGRAHPLGWGPHMAVTFDFQGDVIQVTAAASSATSITAQGHLRLPLAVRRRCRIDAGTRLLVMTRPDPGVLTICTMATVQEMLLARLATVDPLSGTPS